MTTTMSESEVNLCRAQNVVDEIWQRASDSFMSRLADGRPVEGFPELTEAEAHRIASQAGSALAALAAIDVAALPHQLALTVKVARFQVAIDAQAADRYWLAQDCGTSPAMFPIGPYGGRYLTIYAPKALTDFIFSRPGDCDRYLALLEDYARLVGQVREKLMAQATRGIRIPQPALPAVRELMASQAVAARERLLVHPHRLGTIAAGTHFTERVARRIEERVVPAFAALLEAIGADYAARAPETIGMAQFEDGARIYEAVVAEHLSMPMTLDAVHRAGHERMESIEDEMARIRAALGYADRGEFHRHLLANPVWVARSEADVQARFDAAIRRIEPQLQRLFNFRPRARYRAARLDPRLEAGLTYGYFQEPTAGHPDGVYYFNASNLSERTLVTAASLIFHELIPGHHFHVASQKENELLHPLRRNVLFTAFSEGWAEYAATLAGEIGMYSDPYERYGRLLMDAFLTCRLVVDTGMNAFGWSLEQARQYMRDHTVMSEAEIGSETLRYSTDVPAKALAYKIGEIKIHELRARSRAVLRDGFDLRAFHDAVLGSGALPLDVLDWHVNQWLLGQDSPAH